MLAHHEIDAPVHAVASHDTASAFVAAPLRSENAAILSSGTWSLLGIELDAPVLSEQAREFNLTNERGVDGTIRLLRNVMGLWLVQECRRHWDASYDELHELAAQARADVPLFDPDDERFLRPGDMPGADRRRLHRGGAGRRPRAAVRSSARRSPRWPASTGSCSSASSSSPGARSSVVHVIGGGARNELLCRLTADLTRPPGARRAGRGDRAR